MIWPIKQFWRSKKHNTVHVLIQYSFSLIYCTFNNNHCKSICNYMFYKTLSSWAASFSGINWWFLCLLDSWQTEHKASWSSSQKNKSLFPWALQRSSVVCVDSFPWLSSLHCSVSSTLDCCLARKLSTMFSRTKLAGGLSLRHSVLQTGHVLLNWPF